MTKKIKLISKRYEKQGELFVRFIDEETGKSYIPVDGFEIKGEDLFRLGSGLFEEVREYVFTCPKCAGHRFGTKNPLEPSENWVRKCNSCSFSWQKKEDVIYLPSDYC